MRLADWMKRERHTDKSFVELVNRELLKGGFEPYTWRSVRPWREGHVVPRPQVVAAIAIVTGNSVTYADHVAENAPLRKRPRGRMVGNGNG